MIYKNEGPGEDSHCQRIRISMATHTKSIRSNEGSTANMVSHKTRNCSKGNSRLNNNRIQRLEAMSDS